MFTLDDLDRAEAIVYAHVPPTPQYAWPLLAEEVGTRCGSSTKTTRRSAPSRCAAGSSTSTDSGGASDARRHHRRDPRQPRTEPGVRRTGDGVPVVIVAPHGNSLEKNAAMRALGAELIEPGTTSRPPLEEAYGIGERARVA